MAQAHHHVSFQSQATQYEQLLQQQFCVPQINNLVKKYYILP